MAVNLSDLVPELLILIVEHLRNEPDTLKSLCLTNSNLRYAAELVLYDSIVIETGKQCVNLLQLLERHPRLAIVIRVIDARCRHNSTDGFNKFPHLISRTPNLKLLTLESPFCNYGRWDGQPEQYDAGQFLAPTLAHQDSTRLENLSSLVLSRNLKSLTVHWNGRTDRYWTIEENIGIIFAHPSLEQLTISCATVDSNVLDNFPYAAKTPLKSLTFIECNLSPGGFHEVLAMPLGLKYLSLGENRRHRRYESQSTEVKILARRSLDFFAALEQQKASLETFVYTPSPSRHRAALHKSLSLSQVCTEDGFAGFQKLTTIDLQSISPESVSLLSDPSTVPPHLEKICLHYHYDSSTDYSVPRSPSDIPVISWQFDRLAAWCTRLSRVPTLRVVEVTFEDTGGPSEVWHDPGQEAISRLRQIFDPRKIRIVISKEMKPRGYIQPYLYGEPVPRQKTVFDSAVSESVAPESSSAKLVETMEA